MQRLGPAPGGRYRHWDTFRHDPPLNGYTAEAQWLAVKLARRALYRPLPLNDVEGHPFQFGIPTPALEMLHPRSSECRREYPRCRAGDEPIDQGHLPVQVRGRRSDYLEPTGRGVDNSKGREGHDPQEGRKPRDRSERMIANNYQGMLYLREFFNAPLTPEVVLSLQRILTEDTLDDPAGAGRFRTAADEIVIEDETGVRLHTPPPASQLAERMDKMCAFANGETPDEFNRPPSAPSFSISGSVRPSVRRRKRPNRSRTVLLGDGASRVLALRVRLDLGILKKASGKYARAYLYTETDDNDLTYSSSISCACSSAPLTICTLIWPGRQQRCTPPPNSSGVPRSTTRN